MHWPDRGVPTDKLVIGNFCRFASGTTFLLGGNQGHDMDAVTPYGFNFVDGATDAWKPVGDTVVGHEVWCGYESTILGGVHIGVGAIIGARAVVAKDVAPFSVVVGEGRVVRHRFDPLRRKLLWRARWWTWDDEHVREALPLLQGADVAALARSVGITPDDVAHDPDPAAHPASSLGDRPCTAIDDATDLWCCHKRVKPCRLLDGLESQVSPSSMRTTAAHPLARQPISVSPPADGAHHTLPDGVAGTP